MTSVAIPVAENQNPVALEHSAPVVKQAETGLVVIPLPPQAPQPDGKDDSLAFKHGGRQYKLLKRKKTRDGNYFIKFEYCKKQYFKGLETNVLSVAKVRAKTYIDKVRAEKWEDVERLKARQTVATFGDIKRVYLPADDGSSPGIHGISLHSAENNAWAMGKVLREGLGVKEAEVDALPLTNVDKMLALKFQDAMVARRCAKAGSDPESQRAAREQAENSSKSIILQARSLFNRNREMVKQYEARGLRVPRCIDEFMSCKLRGRDQQRAEYLAPPDEVVERAFKEVEQLKEVDRECYLAFWLACGCGLRRGEILRARWEYFIIRGGEPWFSGGVGKDGKKIEVPVQSRAWAALLPFKQESGPVLGEAATMEFARRIGTWMKLQGWDTEKKLHELRAYVGSLIYMKDPVAAMMFMRHKSIKVTEKFYVRYGKKKVPDVL